MPPTGFDHWKVLAGQGDYYRTDRYKLVRFYGDMDVWELYDLATDPAEMHNVYGRRGYEEVRQDLHRWLEALRRELGDTTG